MTTHIKFKTPILLMAALLAGCGGKSNAPAGPGSAMPPPEVEVITVVKGKATLTQDLPGRLQAYRTAQVRARVDGIVEKRLFQEGSDVKAGDPLYRIDPRIYKAADVSANADLMIAKQNVERYKSLLDINAVSQLDYDQAVAKAKQAEAAVSRADEDLDNASVPASISGRIGRSQVTEGALVSKGEATLLATIEQIDPIYVNFTRPGAEVWRLQQAIKTGKNKRVSAQKIELLLQDGSIYPLRGKLQFSDLAVDPDTGSISMRAVFPNPRHELLPGMFVQVRFPMVGAEDVIQIPQRAVMSGPQGQLVMTVDAEGKAAPRPIKTGEMAGQNFVVSEGLQPGDQVIVDGLQKAHPGSPVKPVPWDPAQKAAAAGAPAAAPAKH